MDCPPCPRKKTQISINSIIERIKAERKKAIVRGVLGSGFEMKNFPNGGGILALLHLSCGKKRQPIVLMFYAYF